MSTRNLEFLTLSRWLPTTRGSRHLIAPTATNVLLPSLSLFLLSTSLRLCPDHAHARGIVSFFSRTFSSRCTASPLLFLAFGCPFSERGPPRLGSNPRALHAESTRLFYKLPCVAIVARVVGLVISAAWLAQAVRP